MHSASEPKKKRKKKEEKRNSTIVRQHTPNFSRFRCKTLASLSTKSRGLSDRISAAKKDPEKGSEGAISEEAWS